MRKLGVRVASAALAACMMASVLPVGAFAAGNGYDGDVSAYAEDGSSTGTPLVGNITEGGTYTMSGSYTNCIVINTSSSENKDVTIKITGNVNFTPAAGQYYLFRVTNVQNLTIETDDGCTVDTADKTFLVLQGSAGGIETLTINGGTYKSAGAVLQVGSSDDNRPNVATNLNGVTMEAGNGAAVTNRSTGTLTIDGGHYSNAAGNIATLWTNAGTLTVKGGASVENTAGTAVNNVAGTVNLEGGTYKSKSGTVYTASGAETTVTGGEFTRTDVNIVGDTHQCEVFTNLGKLTIEAGTINPSSGNLGAIINNGGTLAFNDGTINATTGAGIQSLNDGAITTVSGGTITGCNGGVSLQAGNLDFTLGSGVTLTGNANDIVLRENQKIKIDAAYDTNSAPLSVRVFDPEEGRAITPVGMKPGVKFISHNGSDWTVEYDAGDGHYYLHKNVKYGLTVRNAAAQLDEGTDDDGNSKRTELDVAHENQIAKGARVELKANDAPLSDDGKEQVFDKWEVTKADGTALTEDELQEVLKVTGEGKATLTMPEYDITVKAAYKVKPTEPDGTDDPTIPAGGDDTGSMIAAVAVTGATVWGLYEASTGLYRLNYMPGIILPTTRAELAMLIWEKADKPAPVSDELFEDIDEDDTDLQQAARWMVEQELMDEDEDHNKFWPGAHVTKLRVCMTWQDAKDKGLID